MIKKKAKKPLKYGNKALGVRQRRLIRLMMSNNNVWNTNWILYKSEKVVMDSLIKRGIVEMCKVYNADLVDPYTTNDEIKSTPYTDTYQLTKKYLDGLVK